MDARARDLRARRARSTSTPRPRARLLGGGAARRGRRLRAGRGAARPASAVGFSALRPPGHHAEPARAMGFCLFANVAVAAAPRARLARRRAGAGARLGRAPRQRHQRDLPRVAPRCCSRASTSTRSSPARGRCPTSARAPGEGYSLNLPVPAGLGRGRVLRAGRARGAAGGARVRARPRARLGRLRRPPRRPAGRLHARDRLLRASWRCQVADARASPVGYVLEGGYDLDALAASVAATMESARRRRRAALDPARPAGRAGGRDASAATGSSSRSA